MSQEDFKIPGVNISGEKLDSANSEQKERTEQIWRDSRMMFTFEKKQLEYQSLIELDHALDEGGEGENELPTDIDIDTTFLDYYSEQNRKLLNREAPQTREAVLVLPGIGMDLDVNRNFLESLARTGRRVISLSMPGCGDSGDPGAEWRRQEPNNPKNKEWEHNFSNYSALLNRLLDELRDQGKIGKDEKVRVVGHSLGGVMGAEFVANNPDKVSALDLIAPGGYRTEKTNPAHIYPATTGEFIWKQGKEVLDRVRQVGMKEVPDIIKRMWLNNFAKKDSKFNWANLKDESAGVLPRMLQRLWEAEVVLQGGLEENIKKASSRLLVKILVGKNDKLFPPADYRAIVSQLQTSGVEVELEVIPDSGHYGCILKSDEFAKAL